MKAGLPLWKITCVKYYFGPVTDLEAVDGRVKHLFP